MFACLYRGYSLFDPIWAGPPQWFLVYSLSRDPIPDKLATMQVCMTRGSASMLKYLRFDAE